MRLQLARIAALAAASALAAGLTGCGGADESLPLRTISIQGPTSGPLKSRVADIRRAAALELEAINGDTIGSRLKLVDGPDPEALATIDALAEVPISGDSQLKITLAPPIAREVKRQRKVSPQIWLLPPDELAASARASYIASGFKGARSSSVDNPLRAGTPSGQYVTPALSAEHYPPAGQEFFTKFNDKYDRAPDRYAIFGYEAVGLIVDALTRVENTDANVTQKTLAESALAIKNRFSPVGHYDVLPSGQTTLFVFQARGRGAPPGNAALIEALR